MKYKFKVTYHYYKGFLKLIKASHSQIIEAKDVLEAHDIFEDYHDAIGTFKGIKVVQREVETIEYDKD